jgi:hypothetical protein
MYRDKLPIAPDVTGMNTIDFFEYLGGNEATRQLAQELADAWVSRELGYVPELAPAA